MSDLLRRRLRKFMRALPKVLSDEDPRAVHDVRVSSRRVQQVLVTMFPKPRSGEARQVVSALKRARRAVGGWRDCDVLIEMLERRFRRVRNPEERRAWKCVLDLAARKRKRELRRALRRLAHRRLFTLAQNVERLTESASRDSDSTPSNGAGHPGAAGVLSDSIRDACRQWRDSLSRAIQTRDPADAHTFRIESKRLRYRIELARDLGADDADRALEFLKSLQDRLGRLHDRGECDRMAAEALASPDLLMREPRSVSLLLRRLAKEQERERGETAGILSEASDRADSIENWIATYCGAVEDYPPAPPGPSADEGNP